MYRIVPLLLVGLCGCSLITVRSTPRQPSGECAGYTPALVDGAITAALTVLAVRSAIDHQCGPDGCHNYDPTGLYILPALGFGISTLWGAGTPGRCRAAST